MAPVLPGQVRDGKAIGLNFGANRKPAKGATKIRIKAEVVVLYGDQVKNLKIGDIHFIKPNSVVAVGPFGLGWHQPLDPLNEETPLPQLVIGFKDQTKEAAIASAHVTGTGPPPEKPSVSLDVMSVGSAYLPRTRAYFRVGSSVGPPFTLQVSYYDKLKRFTVPVDIEVGLGF